MSVTGAPASAPAAPRAADLLVPGRVALVVLAVVHLLARLDAVPTAAQVVSGVALVALAVVLAVAARRTG